VSHSATRPSCYYDSTKPTWEGAGALVVDLEQPALRALARGLSGALLRLGGSPADFLLNDVAPGACSAANLNKTQPQPGAKYFCPIWDQTAGACLTLARWQALLEFAGAAGLSLVLDLNACWGRAGAADDSAVVLPEGCDVVEAPFGGVIWKMLVSPGDSVGSDSHLAIIEAMKMECPVESPGIGTIEAVYVTEKQAITPGAPMFAFRRAS
jgi:biotin carboxyl carrier protein